MAYFSPATKEITAKIVYYGPGMCGKTTNLQKVHELMRKEMRGELLSVATETDRTIYFDFMPLKLGKIAGFDFVTRVFTVPGQPYYAETRRMVLQGADGVVFVADSQRFMMDQNRDSMLDLKKNLKANNLDYDTIPLILQYNKQDMSDLSSLEELEAALNDRKVPYFRASAFSGVGVVETLKGVTMAVFKHVRDGGLGTGRPSPGKPATAQRTSTAGPAPVVLPPQHPPQPPPTTLEEAAARLARNAEQSDAPPMPSRDALAAQEFQNLAVLHHKLVERVATLETDLNKLKRDYQDLKAIVGKRLLATPSK